MLLCFAPLCTCMAEKAMAPHSSTLAWKIPWMEEAGGLQSMGSLRVGHDWATSLSLSRIGEGNGNPLHYSCLKNPMDGGAWWAAIYGVAQSQTRLKRLSSSSSSTCMDEAYWKCSKNCFPSSILCFEQEYHSDMCHLSPLLFSIAWEYFLVLQWTFGLFISRFYFSIIINFARMYLLVHACK